jgi:glycosyltransferase involved in cell wall biosynthesis
LIDSTTEKPDLIVIVNGGDAETDQVVESFKNRTVDVSLVRTKNKNLAASRNVGLPHCAGDIIAMTDDDAEVSPDWVTQIKAHAEYVDAGA